MSVTKDSKTDKWMALLRVKDWTGKVIHKKKRGFATKREALQWERDFIAQASASLGTTFRDFLDGAGHEGGNVENLRVYGRDGEPCTVCGTEIQLTKIAGRGTRYCPKCQK